MNPSILPCKCLQKCPPALVKTDTYKVRARIEGCRQRSYIKVFDTSIDLPLEPQFYWNNCICNEHDAAIRRHYLKPLPELNQSSPEFAALETNVMKMAAEINKFGASSHAEVMMNTRSTIKRRYKEAYHKLVNRIVNIDAKQAMATMFVKYEKIPLGKFDSGKPPRLIQFRDFTYVYMLKRCLLGHSLQIKNRKDLNWFGQPVNTIFTKVHDSYGVGKIMHDSWSQFSDPVAICIDHSKFDGHYEEALLKLEHKYWKAVCNSRQLNALLAMQYNNIIRSKNGLFAKVKGKRLSGEYTTSEGNTTMNYAMIVTWLLQSGMKVGEFRIHVNGDDSVIILERKKYSTLKPLTYFKYFGMETELDRVVDQFQQISFCQASPIRVLKEGELVWYMVKEPVRTISRMRYTDIKFRDTLTRYLVGVGLCELAVNSGVPITQELSLWMCSQDLKPLGSVDKIPAQSSGNVCKWKAIDDVTRSDYAIAFGISVVQQLHIEKQLAGCISSPTELKSRLTKYEHFIYH